MILYIKSPKDSTKKKKIIMLELMNRFSKVAGYKTNINCCFSAITLLAGEMSAVVR